MKEQNQLFTSLLSDIDTISRIRVLDRYKKVPLYISNNLNPKFEIREYQKEALARFSYYFNEYP
jgi:type III restriction enzyme